MGAFRLFSYQKLINLKGGGEGTTEVEDYIAACKALETRQKLFAFRKAVSEIVVLMFVCSECLSSKSSIGLHIST